MPLEERELLGEAIGLFVCMLVGELRLKLKSPRSPYNSRTMRRWGMPASSNGAPSTTNPNRSYSART